MECYGNYFEEEEEWVNLESMFSSDQHSNHFPDHGLFLSEHGHGLNLDTPIFWPTANASNSSSSYVTDDQIFSYPSDHNLSTVEGDSSNFLFLAQFFSDDAVEEMLCLKQDEVVVKGKMENSAGHPTTMADRGKETPFKRKCEMVELPDALEEANNGEIHENPKKKTRVSRDNKKKNSPPKKNQKMTTVINSSEDEGEESYHNNEKLINNCNGRKNVQSSSSSSSEGESNASQNIDGGAANLTVKTRAGRGAATDPQSIYARKRRERINERLRILQTLVPNGTKVDISTMLEEAVHYVKFLQHQIKLLSSDDMWMYAPIAYNGMDMGLYQNISQKL